MVRLNTGGRYAMGHVLDDDHDGWSECAGDCNDANVAVHPGAPEICDGIDNQCPAMWATDKQMRGIRVVALHA